MVRYLGDLIALQDRMNFVPKVYVGDGQEAAIFAVNRGIDPAAPVSVVDAEGEGFYIPRPNYLDLAHDLSTQSISIVADVLNGAVSVKSLPQVSSFTLTPTLP